MSFYDDPLHDERQEVARQRHEDGADDLRRKRRAEQRDEARDNAVIFVHGDLTVAEDFIDELAAAMDWDQP